jgi:hypothetical protein
MKHAVVLIAVLFMLLNTGKADSEISQYFDHHGKAVKYSKKPSAERRTRIRRYSLPEGVALQKDITYEFYPVFGKTFAEIVSFINENGPVSSRDNRRYPSKSEWFIRWSYEFEHSYVVEKDAGLVHISVELYNVSTDHDITITLPTLVDTSQFNPIERNLWKEFFVQSLDYEHALSNILKDPAATGDLANRFSDITYYSLKYWNGMNTEKEVRRLIRQDTMRIGRDWVAGLRKKMSDVKRDPEADKLEEKPSSSEPRK